MNIQPLKNHWFDCSEPRLVRNRYTSQFITVGCGHCAACRVKKIMHNVPLLVRESSSHKYSMFVTLTYKDEFLPHVYLPDYEKNLFKDYPKYYYQYQNAKNQSRDFISLYKGNIPVCKTSDIQNFIKRLRMSITRTFPSENIQIRYAFSWDYGSTLFRPHYHGLIWFDSDRLHDEISTFIVNAWSIYNRSTKQSRSIGRVDVEDSYNCAKYVSAYMQSIDHLPLIYTTKDFRVRMVHSSCPPLGSLIRTLETPQQIVTSGLTKVSIYNPLTFKYDIQPLTSSFVRRYFPTIASFKRLSRDERFRIYRISQAAPESHIERIKYFNFQFNVNSFFRDYITLGSRLTEEQKIQKFDILYYTVNRLLHQSSLFNISLRDYDSLIDSYYYHRFKDSIKKQFDAENSLSSLGYTQQMIDSIVDIASNTNARGCSQYLEKPTPIVSPLKVDKDFFNASYIRHNKLIKRKCDNSYLELHPEFKQFHL